MSIRIQSPDRIFKNRIIKRRMPVAFNIRPINMLPSHILEQLNQSIFIGFFVVIGGHIIKTPYSSIIKLYYKIQKIPY